MFGNQGNQQLLEQQTAYNKKVTYDMFMITMEWLEKCIEIGGYYPDWEQRKQIRNNLTIERQDIYGNLGIAEDSFSTQLLLFQSVAKTKSPAIREEIKKEFYKWVSATGIDANNIPRRAEKLKHFLYEINEVLEGRGDKVRQDANNEKPTLSSDSPEYMQQLLSLFSNAHNASRGEIEAENSLRGKTDRDIKVGGSFKGGDEQGENAYNRITNSIAGQHNNFQFFPQQEQRPKEWDLR